MHASRCRIAVAAIILTIGLQDASRAQNINWIPSFGPGSPAQTNTGSPALWFGADWGSMVVLDSTSKRMFWGFADTIVQPPGSTNRYDNTANGWPNYVGNSIAIVNYQNGAFTPTYYIRGTGTNPKPFFEDPLNPSGNAQAGTRLWAQEAFLYGGKLFVFLIRFDSQAGAIATLLARVNNPSQPPFQWQYDLLRFSDYANPIYGYESFFFNGYLHVYGHYAVSGVVADVVAVRFPAANLLTTPANGVVTFGVEHLTGSPSSPTYTWAPGLFSSSYRDVGFEGSSGFSARYNPAIPPAGKWQVVYNEAPSSPPSPVVKIRVADAPFGPWSAPLNLKQDNGQDFVFPEFVPGSPVYHPQGGPTGPGPYVKHVMEKEDFAPDPNKYVFISYVGDQLPPPDQWSWIYTDLNYYRPWPVYLRNPFVP